MRQNRLVIRESAEVGCMKDFVNPKCSVEYYRAPKTLSCFVKTGRMQQSLFQLRNGFIDNNIGY